MLRRQFVALLAAAAAGCTDRATPTPRPPVRNASRSEGGSRDWEVPVGVESSEDPFVSFVVGDPSVPSQDVRPHYVIVENRAERERPVGLRVRDPDAGEPAIDTELRFPPRGLVQVELATPATYEVSVTVSGTTRTVTVDRSSFDCNESATALSVHPDGGVDDRTVTQSMGCGTEQGNQLSSRNGGGG